MPNQTTPSGDYRRPPDGRPVTMNGVGERGFADILRDIIEDLRRLVRSEMRLAAAEVREDTTRALRASVWLAMGVVAALGAATLLLWTAVFALAMWLPMWGATLAVCAVLAVASIVLLLVGRRRLQVVQLTPERAVDSVKEDLEWIRQSTR